MSANLGAVPHLRTIIPLALGVFHAPNTSQPWTIFLYTNNYLREFDPPCKHFPRILGLRPHALPPQKS